MLYVDLVLTPFTLIRAVIVNARITKEPFAGQEPNAAEASTQVETFI